MRSELLGLAASLAASGEPFVVAVVVRREPASSAQVGNMAVISQRGDFHGWLGGSCIQPTVVREAQAALADGTPRLISLSPDPSSDKRPGSHGLSDDLPQWRQRGHLHRTGSAGRRACSSSASRPWRRRWCGSGRRWATPSTSVDPDGGAAAFPDADRLCRATSDARPLRPPATPRRSLPPRASATKRRSPRPSQRARLSRGRREPKALRADPRDAARRWHRRQRARPRAGVPAASTSARRRPRRSRSASSPRSSSRSCAARPGRRRGRCRVAEHAPPT